MTANQSDKPTGSNPVSSGTGRPTSGTTERTGSDTGRNIPVSAGETGTSASSSRSRRSSAGRSGEYAADMAGSAGEREDMGHAGTTGDRWGEQPRSESETTDWSASRLNDFGNQAREMMDRLTETLDLRGLLERRPLATLGLAFGIGYLLGGGRFGAAVIGTAARSVLVPVLRERWSSRGSTTSPSV